jgi:hypothetical protein
MEKIELSLEMQPTRILGSIKTRAGSEFNIYSTASREHVLMFPITSTGKQGAQGTPVKVVDLNPGMRQRLGC